MATPPKYTMTNDSISIFWDGKMHTVQKGTANFVPLRDAIMLEEWDKIPNNLTVAKSLKEWAKGKFTLENDQFMYEGRPVQDGLNDRMTSMATAGEDPEPLFKFWEKLQKNPSYRSVEQLWPFLKQKGIPLTKDGNFLAYKAVRSNYKDVHSGEFDNSPGVTNEMPRNQISDDPNQACHEGFHVGALQYASTFGGSDRRIVVCEIDPEHVVCVPFDSSQQKMRVCKYKVIGNHNGEFMANTVHTSDAYDEHEQHVDEHPQTSAERDEEDVEGDDDGDDDSGESIIDKAAGVVWTKKQDKKSGKKKSFPKFDKMKMDDLMKESIEDLRQYAGKGLLIVGASKIPGGKTALVSKILDVRRK